jgi:hypothetical protein
MNKWLKEVEDALADAIQKAEIGRLEIRNLYMLAPILYSEKFNMRDESLIQEMIDENDAQVAEDYSHDEKSKDQYKFHFVSSYLHCFVVAGKFDEMKYDRIMEYVCDRMSLFTDDYGQE